jgi:hypothetical protein
MLPGSKQSTMTQPARHDTIGTCQSRQKARNEWDKIGTSTWKYALLTSFVDLSFQPTLHGGDVVF